MDTGVLIDWTSAAMFSMLFFLALRAARDTRFWLYRCAAWRAKRRASLSSAG